MTAEIAILNQSGGALAADSAVTIEVSNNDKKIYNTATKLFMLSKYHPIGIMIYNNAKIMGIEWEIIIKEYRKKLGKQKFGTLKEYCKNFIEYLNTASIFYKKHKQAVFDREIMSTIRVLKKNIQDELDVAIKSMGTISDTQVKDLVEKTVDKMIKDIGDEHIIDCDFNIFLAKFKNSVDSAIENEFKRFGEDIYNKVLRLIYNKMASFQYDKDYTGIVIAGYGEDEIFPSIINLIGKNIIPCIYIYKIVNECKIDHETKAKILPFAQSDMVKSFTDGIDPFFDTFLKKQLKVIFDNVRTVFPLSKSQTDLIEAKFYENLDDYKKRTYITPLLSIVASLPKIDLAEMAESLVNLTAFKRHVSADAETVGGPTDVAIISKGDGFIWVKRKHYFDPKLNQHFFENYYRENE